MFKRTFVVLAKLSLFIAVVWLIVMTYWKYTDHVVSSEDLLIYFFILPVALLLAYFLFRILRLATKKLFSRFHTPKSPTLAAVTTTQAEAQRVAERRAPTYVLATAVSTYFGDESTLMLDAILQEKSRVEIHAEFTQELGYGVRVAEVGGLEVDTPQEGARDTLLRTLALLQTIYVSLSNVLGVAAPHPQSPSKNDRSSSGVQLHPEWKTGATPQEAMSEGTPEDTLGAMPTALNVHIVLPDFLTLPEISLVQTEVTTWLQTLGWSKHIVSLTPIQPEQEVDYLRRLHTWQQQTSREQSVCEWLLILSAVSWLDVDLLNDKLQRDTQFADRLARGGTLIGEAACGMVLANTRPDPRLGLTPLTQLSMMTLGQRNKPIDAKGTIEAGLLTEMLADQLSEPAESATQVVGMAASGDLSRGRAVEMGRWVTDELPQLDFIEDVIHVADHMGEGGACNSVLALILATAMAHEREGKALYCANQHASWRALAVAQPLLAA